MGGVEYQVTKVDPTDPHTKGAVYQVHKVSEEIAATIGGKVYRARIINDPTAPTVAGKVYQIVLIDDPDDPSVKGMVYNAILTGGSEAVVIGPAVPPLVLPDAIANSLSYVKAFGGTEQRNLPSGYTQLEYIEMTGAQYLDTGITGYANTNVLKTKINASQVSNTMFVTFQNPNSGADNLGLFLSYSRWSFQYGSPSRLTSLASANTDVSIEATNGILKINGVSVTGTPTSEFSISEPILIGASINGTTIEGRKFQGKIYYFRWEDSNGNVLFDGVPAKDSNNVAGMYDTVSGRFLTNQGFGSITAGPEVVPTPDAPIDIVINNGVLKARHQSGLPLGYTLLDSATNASGGYLDTGIIADVDDIEFDIVAKINDSAVVSWYILQSRANASAPIYGISGSQSGNTFIGSFSGVNNPIPYTTAYRTAGHTYHVNLVCKNGTNTLTVEDLTTGDIYTNTATYTFTAATTNIGLFSNINGGTVTSGNTSVTSAYIKKSGVKVLDYVPALQGTTAGFYDKVTGTFKGATAGSFVAGDPVSDPVEIYTDGTVETIEDTIGNTATTEMLLKVGNYQDAQSILDGVVMRNVGVKVLDGTEDWSRTDARAKLVLTNSAIGSANWQPYCTHYQGFLGSVTIGNMPDNSCKINVNTNELLIKDATHNTDLATWKQYLADQYAAGTPVIVLYPLATPTTESVAGQALQVTGGDNVLEITQASLDNLELEAEYEKESA